VVKYVGMEWEEEVCFGNVFEWNGSWKCIVEIVVGVERVLRVWVWE
jgi:hypothetical protein